MWGILLSGRTTKVALVFTHYMHLKTLADMLNAFGVEPIIPRPHSTIDCNSVPLIYTDDEKIAHLFLSSTIGECIVRVIENNINPLEILTMVFNDIGYRPLELIIGVDPGPKYAYTVIVDGVILEINYVEDLDIIMDRACRYTKLFKPLSSTLKVGFRIDSTNMEKLTMDYRKSCDISIEYVDESMTTRQYLLPKKWSSFKRRQRDFIASLNIALKHVFRKPS